MHFCIDLALASWSIIFEITIWNNGDGQALRSKDDRKLVKYSDGVFPNIAEWKIFMKQIQPHSPLASCLIQTVYGSSLIPEIIGFTAYVM